MITWMGRMVSFNRLSNTYNQIHIIEHSKNKNNSQPTRIVSRDRERSLAYEDGEAFGDGAFRVADLDDVQGGVQEVRDEMDFLNDELNSCGLK